jgi:preprotein translocase subunit SecE
MAATTSATSESFWGDLFSFRLYKRNQGKVVRQVTGAALGLWVLFGAWSLFNYLNNYPGYIKLSASGAVLVVGLAFAFRLVNWPRFADFLIATEAEMKKVSWPSRAELMRGTIVVLVVMFFLAIVLFAYDFMWRLLFTELGVLQSPPPPDA